MTAAESTLNFATTPLTGWGANVRSDCHYAQPETPAEVARRLDRRGTIARGLGRSYGDPALNADGVVLGMSRLDRYLQFDEASGTLTCEAGVSLGQIIRDFAPRGFFPMISPGTKYVTVGGCIANDIHGKAHHVQGSFCSCVDSMRVLLASGEVVHCSRSERSDLFWASFGGIGLLGIVLDATLRLRRVETSYYRQKAIVAGSLEEMLEALEQYDREYPYSVANIHPLARGAQLGWGVLTVGDHAKLSELPPELARDPLRVAGDAKLNLPFELPAITFNPLSVRALHAVAMTVFRRARPFGHYEGFTYPLDFITNWNRGYGRSGFTQYQFVVPFAEGARRLREILTVIADSGELPALNVLKRFGPPSDGLLSFPREGYTFAIDFPIRRNTIALTRTLDGMVLDAGGRVYLGKDSYLEAASFRAMYPRFQEWQAVKSKYDPQCVFVSDQARRVGLVPF
jgi:FAD/FMN-containing dehydrogenase